MIVSAYFISLYLDWIKFGSIGHVTRSSHMCVICFCFVYVFRKASRYKIVWGRASTLQARTRCIYIPTLRARHTDGRSCIENLNGTLMSSYYREPHMVHTHRQCRFASLHLTLPSFLSFLWLTSPIYNQTQEIHDCAHPVETCYLWLTCICFIPCLWSRCLWTTLS